MVPTRCRGTTSSSVRSTRTCRVRPSWPTTSRRTRWWRSSLGRSLAGGAANLTVDIIKPGTEYGERLNQLDLRLGKLLRFNATRTLLSMDIYNLFNASSVLDENPNYAAFRRPTAILIPRFVRFSAQFDF